MLKRVFCHLAAIAMAAVIALGAIWAAGKIDFPAPGAASPTAPHDPVHDPFWPPTPAPAPTAPAPAPVYR
ncbi:hypothetical protein GCM10009577_46690 [Streptomyces javensis]